MAALTRPMGQATLTYDSTQTKRTLSITIANLQLPDGDLIEGILQSDGLVDFTGYYPSWVPQSAGIMVVKAGKAAITLSTAKGDDVPLFGANGNITLSAWTPHGVELGFVASGSYPTKGGKRGG